MIGSRIGSKSTLYGSAVGSSADDEGGFTSQIPGVSRDAGSGRYAPANSTEWTAMMAFAGLATGNPSLLWDCQDGAGNLNDIIGGFTGTQSGTVPTYQQSVPGWARKGVMTADAATTQFSSTAAGLPDGLTNSQLTLCYINVSANAALRGLLGQHSDATSIQTRVNAGHNPVIVQVTGGVQTTGTSNLLTGPAVLVLKNDRTNLTQTLYTGTEKLSVAFSALVSGKKAVIGAPGSNTATATFMYFASFFNSAAELSDTQIKTLLTALGWTIPWS